MTDVDNLITTQAGRSASTQAYFQLAALGVTLGMAIVGGLLTGLIMRIPVFERIREESMFDDDLAFITPEDYSFRLAQIRVSGQRDSDERGARQHLIAK